MSEVILSTENAWVEEDKLAALYASRREAEAAGQPVVDLSMINPDIPPARSLLDRLVEGTLKAKNHRYSVARGVRRLRDSLCAKYRHKFSVQLDAESDVCVSAGAKDGVVLALSACAKPGATVLMPAPLYPAHRAAARLCGLHTYLFEMYAEPSRTIQSIRDAARVAGACTIVLNYPNNPTGATVSSQFWSELGQLALEFNLTVINDFTYGELVYQNAAALSMLSDPVLKSRGVEVYSLSKAYSVPGWRIGGVLGCSPIVKRVAQLKAHLDYGAFLPLQIAAAYALSTSEDLAKGAREQYNMRATLVFRSLSSLGFQVKMPEAGCCVWARLPERCSLDSFDFCSLILRRKGVMLMPGLVFGDGYTRYVRLALVAPEPELREVLRSVEEMLSELL